MFLRVLMLITLVHQRSVSFANVDKSFMFQPPDCNCHHNIIMSIESNSIVILKIHGVDYCCIIFAITKKKAINLLKTLI